MNVRRILLVVVMAITVSSCGMQKTIAGTPIAAPAIPSITGKNPPSLPPRSPTTDSSPSATSSTESSETPTSSTPPADGPEATVRAYFDAINSHDLKRAWDLGGKNVGQSYSAFAAGFGTTDHDEIAVQSVNDNTVTLDLTAFQSDGTQRRFHGTYTVTDGVITKFSVRPAS
ncbi:hypothetical protein ACFQ1S_16325 [Kibdelosporangium lantanae]|uniref:SnoaL-like domain-containing protein n=1 Tax=Kibdelosporangium lantanae TaxID=1497396 RepID=A0ABW3MBD1_9PSEU